MAGRAGYQTRAQQEVLRYLKAEPGRHHTVQEIKDHLAREGKPIGTATIYRQLDHFVEEGCVQRYVLGPQDSACYAYEEATSACATHFHCKCEQCGRLIHLDCDELKEIQSHLLTHHGFAWNAGKTVFYGICDQCQGS